MSFNTYDESVWFKLFQEKLKQDFKSVGDLTRSSNVSHACVACIIRLNRKYPSNDLEPFDMLFIRRAFKKGDPWSGHIAFPGGRHENNESLQETAERETMEEIGIDISKKKGNYICLGHCHSMDITRLQRTLRIISFVYLQCIKETPSFKLSVKEVDSISWINFNQLKTVPLQYSMYLNNGSNLANNNKLFNKFGRRNESQWTHMMIDPLLTNRLKYITNKYNNHINLKLEYKTRLLPANAFKYPAIILKTNIIDNDYWMLWGLTYRMVGYILTSMKINHHLRYKHVSKGSYGLGHSVMYIARYFLIDLKIRSGGIEPYFSSKIKSNL